MTQKVAHILRFHLPVRRAILILGAALLTCAAPLSVYAVSSTDQIKQLQSQIDSYQAEASRLRAEGDNLQSALNGIIAEKNVIQTEINLSQAKYDTLIADIAANEKKLADQQKVMATAISDLAQESTTSPIELLASSGSIGDYIDQQEYSSSIRDQLESSIKQVKELKEKLTQQKKEVEQVLADQKSQRDQLAAKEQEQSALLNATRGEEASYQQLTGKLKDQKAAAEAALARSLGSGSYRVSPVGAIGAGGVVGSVGNSGLSSGPHLHLEARNGGGVTNPDPYIEVSPIDMPPGYVSQGYGNRDSFYVRGYHPGTDYAANSGAPIYAISGGYLYRGCSNQMLGTSNNEYGYVAIVEHTNGIKSVYAHMSGGPGGCSYNTYY